MSLGLEAFGTAYALLILLDIRKPDWTVASFKAHVRKERRRGGEGEEGREGDGAFRGLNAFILPLSSL